ncbi:glucan endo-1 3-beta-glucosidase basic isoform [Phtheirospermum japonicum]|uniref:Glucan endo-1 3-beta-glucosidase basic isoform n=1 Tax=Phtheirospermum japonicum TaxID=374723 RepID=A0A830CX90_9LAMI|nr:glucan endo-1 3-beta-glucosidase basic isoform [Phtheirospermum japonicum]
MKNINNAISAAGLVGIKVSTAISTEVLGKSYPPSEGTFRPEVTSYLTGIIGFLNKAKISLDYALFKSDGVIAGGVKYQNLFYAILDAMYAALEKSGGPSLEIVVSESGWPSAGGDATNVDNAKSYYTNLVQRVKDGTPKRPGRAIETYLFAMFDENQKTPEYEKKFGVFTASKQLKYPINFS